MIGAVKKNLMWVAVFPVFSLHELQNKKSIADKATLLTAIRKWFVSFAFVRKDNEGITVIQIIFPIFFVFVTPFVCLN